MSWLSDLTGAGGGSSYKNPVPLPDLSFLKDSTKLNGLKDSSPYNYLLNNAAFQGLNSSTKNPYAATLPGAGKTFASTYKAPGYGTSDALYGDLIKSTSGPSTVDAVREQLNTDQLNQTLAGVDADTAQTVGNLKGDFLDRGLSGPGMISEIESSGLANAYNAGDKTKAAARTANNQATLDLLKNRENQNIAAKTAAASGISGQEQQSNQIAASGAEGDVNNYNQLLGTQANLGEQDLNRQSSQLMDYYNLINGNQNKYADITNTNNDLYAQLINARDLGLAGDESSLYNTGAQLEAGSYKPGVVDNLLRNVQVSIPVK